MAYRVSYRGSRGFSLGPIGFLIVINLILYIATSINPELFKSLFGLQPISFLARPWTIVTNMFIHSPFSIHAPLSSMWHILANMLTLYFFGSYLTRLVGDRKFFIVYFCGGILGNVIFILYSFMFWGISQSLPYMLQTSPYSTVIGASGAVFAVAGVLTVLSPKLKVFIIPIPVPIPLWIAVIGAFLILSFMPGVAWQAHLGGLVFGLVAALFFRGRQRHFF